MNSTATFLPLRELKEVTVKALFSVANNASFIHFSSRREACSSPLKVRSTVSELSTTH